jgi:hypothetical protein
MCSVIEIFLSSDSEMEDEIIAEIIREAEEKRK